MSGNLVFIHVYENLYIESCKQELYEKLYIERYLIISFSLPIFVLNLNKELIA
jgi:hypothetical protein